MPSEPAVREMRLVVTATDYAEAVHFYRDVLGLPERASYSSPDGQVSILEAGRATLEIADPAQAEFIDRVEVGRRVAGHIRVAFEVADSAAMARRLGENGATLLAEATLTPWQDLNARLEAPGGLQLTLFSEATAAPRSDRASSLVGSVGRPAPEGAAERITRTRSRRAARPTRSRSRRTLR